MVENMSDKTRKYDNKNRISIFLLVISAILLVMVILLAKEVFVGNKYEKLEKYLSEYYYSEEHLGDAIKNTLEEKADNNDDLSKYISDNFDNYIFNLVLEDINKQEPENIAGYNDYLNRTEADKVVNILEEPAVIETSEIDDIFYIKIPTFTRASTYMGLIPHFEKMRECKKFIIDLRGNTGGDTDELVDILSLFYTEGSVVYTEKSQNTTTEYKANNSYPLSFEKIVFLCDSHTASASEAMIFNMKSDYGNKIAIVGSKTYGKNFYYSYKQFSDGELFMFVSGLMCNSKGETFNDEGINPDYQISEYEDIIETAKDMLS